MLPVLNRKNGLIGIILTGILAVKAFIPATVPKHMALPEPVISPPVETLLKPGQQPPQLVVLSFDGSRSLTMWKQTLDFAHLQASRGISIKFTYFISGVYLLPWQDRLQYQSPGEASGESKIGFADNSVDMDLRVELINRAITDGHEIGSHLNGHFPGGSWSTADWRQEFDSFNRLISGAARLAIKPADITGFRAPNLAFNPRLWPVLKSFGYRYEAGQTGKSDAWPQKTDEIWRFILPAINLAGTKQYPLAMDYNFYLVQSGARDIYKKDTPAWQKALTQTVNSLMQYFNYNYSRNRAPVVWACHFSEWNDGLYWEAMKQFAENVCGKAEVKCVTYHTLADIMDQNPDLLKK